MGDDYQQYVIDDGRLVGAWDAMYAGCGDPWLQSQEAGSGGHRAIVRFAHAAGAHSLLEVGCGLGYFTAELVREGFDVRALDTSEVAIERARRIHPLHADRFEVGHAETDLPRFAGVDAVVFAEVTWYLLDHLDGVLAALRRHHEGALLIHLLTFYAPGRQRYGRDFFTTPDELVERFGFEVVDETRCETRTEGDYESTILFRIV